MPPRNTINENLTRVSLGFSVMVASCSGSRNSGAGLFWLSRPEELALPAPAGLRVHGCVSGIALTPWRGHPFDTSPSTTTLTREAKTRIFHTWRNSARGGLGCATGKVGVGGRHSPHSVRAGVDGSRRSGRPCRSRGRGGHQACRDMLVCILTRTYGGHVTSDISAGANATLTGAGVKGTD